VQTIAIGYSGELCAVYATYVTDGMGQRNAIQFAACNAEACLEA